LPGEHVSAMIKQKAADLLVHAANLKV